MGGNVSERVRHLVQECFEVSFEEISPETHLEGEFGADSLDIVELTNSIEEEFEEENVEFDPAEIPEWRTVGDVIDAVEALISEPSATP